MAAIFITLIIAAYFPGGKISRYDTALAECERELPRNKTCKIIAVVNDKSNG